MSGFVFYVQDVFGVDRAWSNLVVERIEWGRHCNVEGEFVDDPCPVRKYVASEDGVVCIRGVSCSMCVSFVVDAPDRLV